MTKRTVDTASIVPTEGTTDLNDGEWHHVAGTYDGADVRIYVDGVQENSASQTGNMVMGSAPVRIGAAGSVSVVEDAFDGSLGHAALWDTFLTAGEIKSLSEGVSPLKIHKNNMLLFYVPINGQSPEIDIIGGLDLTITGTTIVEEPPIPNSIVAP